MLHETPSTQEKVVKTSKEPLFGAILFASMLVFVLLSIGGIGWTTYVQWQERHTVEQYPSIHALEEKESETTDLATKPSSQETENVEKEAPTTSVDVASAKKTDIIVLNGGATKGSAGILADFLKKEGYTKTTTGNTVNNYTGVVVYYATSLEKEATFVKESVVKQYPQASVLPADTKNKETTAASIVVIVGK